MVERYYQFEQFELSAQQPYCIAEQAGYFWFPKLHRWGDRLLCLVATTADVAQGTWTAVCFQSEDKGETWSLRPEPIHYSHASVLQKTGCLLLLPYEFEPLSDDYQAAQAVGQCYRGVAKHSRVVVETIRFLGFPQPLAAYAQTGICLLSNANVLALNTEWITTVYGRFANDSVFSIWCFVSFDQGLTWHYRSTVALGAAVQTQEGASESCLAVLADNRLLCIYRIGSGSEYCYAKSYSDDAGKTWTAPELMPTIGAVAPQLLKLENGVLVLAGGRPGLHLWCSSDGAGEHWAPWDLGAHHNASASIVFDGNADQASLEQSTCYVSLVGLSENELLVCYDELSNGWQAAEPERKNRVFMLKVRIDKRNI